MSQSALPPSPFAPWLAPRCRRTTPLALALAFISLSVAPVFAEFTFEVGPRGLNSLRWGSWEFLGNPTYQGDLAIWGAPRFQRSDASTYSGTTEFQRRPTVSGTVAIAANWGGVQTAWRQVAPDHITCTITVTNATSDILLSLNGPLLIMDYPVANPPVSDSNGDGTCNDYPRTVRTRTGAPLVTLSLGAHGTLAITLEGDLRSDWQVGSFTAYNADSRRLLSWTCQEPIPPGTSRSQTIGIRAASGSVAFARAADDVLMRYVGTWPPRGERSDRRPIARDFLSNPPEYAKWPGTGHPEGNPRGYFHNSDLDILTDAGKRALRQTLLDRANGIIANLRQLDGQGVIVWDIEGQQEPHMTSYVGSPDRVYDVAPEMAYVPPGEILDTATAYFRSFIDAGFKPGVCLRPQRYVGTYPGPYQQIELSSKAELAELIRHKVDFAVTRWGVTFFYVDSNVHNAFGWPIPDRDLFGPALAQHPQIRLMGEWENAGSWGVGAPYNASVFDNVYETSQRIREIWPDAHSSIVVRETATAAEIQAYRTAALHGDALLFNGWYPSPDFGVVRDAVADASNRPEVQLNDPPNGTAVPLGTTMTLRATPTTWPGRTIRRVMFRSGPVPIGDVNGPPWTTTWTATLAGPHQLSASVEDDRGAWGFSAYHAITVTDGPPANRTPLVNAGRDIRTPSRAALAGSVRDDALPAGQDVRVTWSQQSGPGQVTFTDRTDPFAIATFSDSGTYVLRLTASDGVFTSSDTVSVEVVPGPSNVLSLFGDATPAFPNATDGVPYELGVKIRSSQAGSITAIRYFKASSESGPHTGRIWTVDGQLLASVAFEAESSADWQEQALPAPLPIAANTTFVVTVNCNSHYVATQGGLLESVVKGPLSTVEGDNGIFGPIGQFPTRSWNASNYFRDIVFAPANAPSPGPGTGNGSTTGGGSTSGSATAGSSSGGGTTGGTTSASTSGGGTTGAGTVGNGLKAEFFAGITLAGAPLVTRIDSQVNFGWGRAAPAPGVPADLFSARWSGALRAGVSGRYTLRTQSDDGVRLSIGGLRVIDNWTDHGATYNTATVDLTAGAAVPVVMEYYERRGNAVARLQWRPPGASAFEAIPEAHLLTAGRAPVRTYLLTGSGTPERIGDDTADYELGMRFRSSSAAWVRSIRFFKVASETGSHTGRIWDEDGTLLASVPFPPETNEGWQTASLAESLELQANRSYTVSVNCNARYAFTLGGLAAPRTAGPLTTVVGGNGVFHETPGTFPTSNYGGSDYSVGVEVDVR